MLSEILALLMACLTLLSPGMSAGAEEREDPAQIRMLNDLLGVVYQGEILLTRTEWALEAVEAFDRTRTWEALQTARAALALTGRSLGRQALPEAEMTEEDWRTLMDRGLDMSHLEERDAMFHSEQDLLIRTCAALQKELTVNVFLNEDWEVTLQHARVMKDYIARSLEHQAVMTDWTLACIHDREVTEAFNALMEQWCPATHAYQAENPEDPAVFEAAAHALLSRMEDALSAVAGIAGMSRYNLNELSRLLESGDLQALEGHFLEISGLPLCLPFPSFYRDADVYYFWTEGEEVLPSPAPGDDLRAPDLCRIRMQDVKREDVLAYREALEQAGYPSLSLSEGEGGSLRILYALGESVFSLDWAENEVTLLMMEQPFFFAPSWYRP